MHANEVCGTHRKRSFLAAHRIQKILAEPESKIPCQSKLKVSYLTKI